MHSNMQCYRTAVSSSSGSSSQCTTIRLNIRNILPSETVARPWRLQQLQCHKINSHTFTSAHQDTMATYTHFISRHNGDHLTTWQYSTKSNEQLLNVVNKAN